MIADKPKISVFQYRSIDKKLGKEITNLVYSCTKKVLVDRQCSAQSGRLTKYKDTDIIFSTVKRGTDDG